MRHMRALGAVARNGVLGSPTEKSGDGPLHHAHAGVANQLCPALPPIFFARETAVCALCTSQ